MILPALGDETWIGLGKGLLPIVVGEMTIERRHKNYELADIMRDLLIKLGVSEQDISLIQRQLEDK